MFFKKNDIVRLRKEYFDQIKSKLFFPQNVFFIDKYLKNEEYVMLRNVNISVPSIEVFPVKIDGVEDRYIYYDSVIAADVALSNDTIKSHHVDKEEYYLQDLKKFFYSNGKSYFDVLHEKHFIYVHELQHSMPSVGKNLRINYVIRPYIKPYPSKMKLEAVAVVMTYKRYVETEHEWTCYIKVYIEKEISSSNMIATSVISKKVAYVLLFKKENHLEAKYAEFYINSLIGKLFLLNHEIGGNFKGRVTIANLRNLVIRWVDNFKECCVYLESLIQIVCVYEKTLNKELSGLLSFLSQVRNAMVMEMMMPELFEKANFSVLNKWKRDTDSIMLDAYLAEDNQEKQIELIGKLMEAICSTNEGVINEMTKYRIYMMEFLRFAEQNKADL